MARLRATSTGHIGQARACAFHHGWCHKNQGAPSNYAVDLLRSQHNKIKEIFNFNSNSVGTDQKKRTHFPYYHYCVLNNTIQQRAFNTIIVPLLMGLFYLGMIIALEPLDFNFKLNELCRSNLLRDGNKDVPRTLWGALENICLLNDPD